MKVVIRLPKDYGTRHHPDKTIDIPNEVLPRVGESITVDNRVLVITSRQLVIRDEKQFVEYYTRDEGSP